MEIEKGGRGDKKIEKEDEKNRKRERMRYRRK